MSAVRKHAARELDTRTNVSRPWQWNRVLSLLECCEALDFLHRAFEKTAGAHRVLTVDAFLAAALLTPLLGTDMHLAMLTATIRGWSPSQRRDVGLDPHMEVTYKMVCDAFGKLRRACECSNDPRWDAGTVAQALLDASLQGQSPSGAVAVDGTDLPCWAKVLFSNPIVDADLDAPPRPENPAPPTDPAHPGVSTRGRRRPDTPIGSDGRAIYSHDVDARMGWRSASFGESEIYLGYEAHVVTDVPGRDRAEVPHVARALDLEPAGSHRGAAGLVALSRAGDLPAPREILCDRAYNYTRPASFSLPLLRRGYTLIVDLHPLQLGMHPGPVPGTMWIDGTLYTTCIPPGLVEVAPITRDMTNEQREHAQQQRRQRQPYAFVPHGARRWDGARRYRGPGVSGSVRCPDVPRSMRQGYEVPTVYCDQLDPGHECGCAKTVTLHDEDFPNIRMPFQHGSAQWFASYHRRVGIESVFGDLKTNRLHLRRGYFRIFGLTGHRLLLGFVLAAMNLMILRDWYRQRDRLDPWGVLLGEQVTQIRCRPHPSRVRGGRSIEKAARLKP